MYMYVVILVGHSNYYLEIDTYTREVFLSFMIRKQNIDVTMTDRIA